MREFSNRQILHMKYFYNKNSFLLILSFFAVGVLNAQNAKLTVSSPSSVQGEYDMQLAEFASCEFESISGTLALGEDDFGTATGCNANGDLSAISNVSGKIAIMDRGNCAFTDKTLAAQDAGAIAVIICNNEAEPALLTMSGENDDITIPSMLISQADCSILKTEIGNNIEVVASRVGITDPNDDDEVIWGANGEGNFENGLGDWETEGLSDASHVWTWIENGNITSKSACGSAIMALSDYQVADGFDLDNPPPPPYNQYMSELISPSIDLSGAEAVAVKFAQYNLKLNGSTFVSTSIDGGTTWSDPLEVDTDNTQDSDVINTELIRLPLSGVGNESDVRIKFTIDGDFFFWGIDDVEIVKLTGNNVSMSDAFYTPISYGFPQTHADADTFFFFATVRNSGGSILNNVKLDVSITNNDSGEEVFSDSGTQASVAIGEVVQVASDNLFVPNTLPVGKYTIQYDLSVLDAAETNQSDNSTSKIFEVTENTFSKEPGPLDNGFYGGSRPGGEWAAAAVYRMSGSVDEYVATNAVTSISSNSGTLTDNFVDVFLVKLNEGIDFANFDFQETDLLGHPSFDIITQNTHVFTTEENGELITVPFSSSGQGVPLEPGESYMVILRFDGTQAGSATVPNEELFLAYNSDPRVANIIDDVGFISDLVVSVDQSQWFSGFAGDPAPVIRMEVELESDVDDIPLAEGSFLVYPNPANDYLKVELDFEETTDATIVMAALDGRILQVKELSNVSKRSLELNVTNLTSGTYILKAYTDKGSTTHKVVITN